MNPHLLLAPLLLALCSAPLARAAEAKPYANGKFIGRIAYSADGNHNDPDDWAASPVALAIFAEAGVKDRLVHFDYNCILPQTNAEWEKIHAASVLGAAERYGYEKSRFHDCRKDLDAAIASIARAINDSSADNPLFFIIAGPMEVPYLGIQKSQPEKRKHVHCISHSRWNDGFAAKYTFTHTKRSVIEQDVNWLQIKDQNARLSLTPYGKPAAPEQFAGYFWMRDSRDPKVQFLWERTLVSTRPDPSDAGMAYFLVTGDEECDPAKLKKLLAEHQRPTPLAARKQVRIEAENFRHLDHFKVEDRNDRTASHRLTVISTGPNGSIETSFDELYARDARCDIEVRYFAETGAQAVFLTLNVTERVGSKPPGAMSHSWQIPQQERGWLTNTCKNVPVKFGDKIEINVRGLQNAPVRLDYLQLNY
ncbi:MAG: hypothetical protein AB1705_03650 [Verrucomicrobiota bacterium]